MQNYEVKMTDINQLIPYESNPRINTKSVEKVADSIRSVGWRVPIVVDEEKIILAGHTRLLAAKYLALSKVPVHTAKGLTEEQKAAYRIMDNKSADFSEWNKALLADEFKKFAELGYDLELTGFDLDEISSLTSDMVDFKEPEEETIIEDHNVDLDDFQTSNVRMVNLFLDQDTEPQFRDKCNKLQEKWSTETLTDTVVMAIEKCASNESI